jgi:hypothetical protein
VLTDAAFQCPASITVDDQDNLYVADTCDNAIRKISTDGKVSTIEPQWTTASGLKSRVIPAPRRVFWVNGKLHVFAGGDAREIGGAIFQLTAELISRNSLFARHPQRSVTLLSLTTPHAVAGFFIHKASNVLIKVSFA